MEISIYIIVKPDSGTLYVAAPIAAGRRPAKSRWPIGHRILVVQVPITVNGASVAEGNKQPLG